MKKIFIFVTLLIVGFFGYAQTPQGLGGPNTIVITRGLLAHDTGFQFRTNYADTNALNNSSYLKFLPGATARTGNTLWIRSQDVSRWIEFGAGSLNIDTTESILLSGDGSGDDPLTANLQVSAQSNNSIQIFPDGVYAQTFVQNGLISGGLVIWQTGLTYTVTAATYAINGVVYTSPETSITLDNSDPTNNRIDGFVVTTSGTAIDLTGTPSTDPQNPSFDPAIQLPLTFVLVTAASTEPTYCRDSIYYPDNGQNWTAAVSNPTRINVTSTTNPYSPTQDVELTLARNNDQLRFSKGSTISWATYSVLTFKIRSKGTWPTNSRLVLRMYSVLTPLGIDVVVGNGIFGFNSSNAADYQTIAIPLSNFGAVSSPDNILFTVSATGGNTIGAYIDNIELLGCNGTPIPTNNSFWQVGGNRQGTTLVGGTLDNFNTQIKTNNTNHTLFQTGGSIQLQGATPRISFQLGTGLSADYFITRSGTDLITNTAGGYITRWTGNRVYSFDKNNGHLWADSLATIRMRLAPTGALRLDAYGDNAFTGTATRWLAVDVDGNVIEQAAPLTAITADNGLTFNTSTNVRLGGTLVNTTIINSNTFAINISGTVSGNPSLSVINSGGTAIDGNGTIIGISGTTTSGIAVRGAATTGYSFEGRNTTTLGIVAHLLNASSGTNTVVPIIVLDRETTGTAANGIGASLQFKSMTTDGFTYLSNEVKSLWSNATHASRVSQYIITGVNAGVTADLLTISGSGATRLNKYGVGSFTAGTPAYAILTDASGNLMEGAVSGSGLVYTADNGLTMTTNNVQLGGSALLGNTSISTSAFSLTINSSNTTNAFVVVNSDASGGHGIVSTANAGDGVTGNSTSGRGVVGFSSTGVGVYGRTTSTTSSGGQFVVSGSNTGVSNTIISETLTSGTVAAGLGGSIDYYIESNNGAGSGTTRLSNQLISKWTDDANATRTSQFIITGVNSAVTADLFTLSGSGALKLNKYGINTFAGVAAYVLAVDASGNVVEVAAAGAGMTNVLTTTGDIIYSSSGTTPARLGIGTAGQVLTVSGGLPVWSTVVGTGSVTDVTWTGGIVSIANSTTVPAFTIAGTSGGIPYFSSSSTWASSAALAANSIVIGGGAGTAPATTTTGTGVLTALGINVGSAGAFVTNGGALGTPSSGTLTNATGLPISTGVSGLGTGVATALAVNVGSAGAFVTFNGALGTPSSATLTNATGLPVSTGISGLGTGVATALAVNTGSAGAFVLFNGNMGTPTSGTISTGVTLGDVTMNVTGADATGDIYYRDAGGLLTRLSIGSAGQVLRVNSGATAPEWFTSAGTGTVTSLTAVQPSSGITITNSGVPFTTTGTWTFALANDLLAVENLATTGIVRRTGTSTWSAGTAVSLTTEVTGTLPEGNGGTGETTFSNGQLLIGDGTGLTKATLTGTANQINVTNGAGSITLSMAFNPTEQTLTDGATVTWNVTNGGNAVWTNNGTGRTLTLSNLVPGYTYTLRMIQGAGGSKTVSTWTNVRWSGGISPTPSTVAGATDMYSFYCVNTTYLIGTYVLNVQ